MLIYNVKIKANPAFPFYMQHRMDDCSLEEWVKARGFVVENKGTNQSDEHKAMFHSHSNGDGVYIPSEQVRCSLINAGKYVKGKVGNATKTMTNIVAAMFYVTSMDNTEHLPLKPQKFEIDKRTAVNKNVKARVLVIRPKWKDWSSEFKLSIDNDTLTDETVRKVIEYSGSYVGIGSYRPEHRGAFGRFVIEKMKKI